MPENASAFIDEKIQSLGDWRGKTLAKVRKIIHDADPEIVEEWKWRGTPVWSHGGIVCTGETYKKVVKLTFAKGAVLDDPSGLFQLQPRRKCPACYRHPRRRKGQRGSIEGPHTSGGGVQYWRKAREVTFRTSRNGAGGGMIQ